MIRKKSKIILLSLLVLSCTVFIFSNSLKNGEESNADSEGIVEFVEEVAEQVAPENKLNWNYIVRKSAHLFEFFMLGITATLLSSGIEKRNFLRILYAVLYSLAVASTDEFIQRFTGRTSRVSDVMIDMLGATLGICLVLLSLILVKRWRSNAVKNEG